MALITLLNAQLAFGHVALLDHTDFSLEAGERVGLIGRNGAGKSSFLKILAGLEKADDGVLQLQQGLRIAYVAQEPMLDSEATVFQATLAGVADVIALIDEYSHGHGDLDKLQGAIEAQDGWNWEQRVEETLQRLHLDKDAVIGTLSGGTKKRVALAPGPGTQARRAAARRAHQPPGPGLHRVAGKPADRLQGQRRHHHPRPHLPGSRLHPHRRTGPRPAALLPGQLQPVPDAEGGTARAGSRHHGQGRQAAGAGRNLDPQGRGGAAHASARAASPGSKDCAPAAPRGARRWAASSWTSRPACPAARSWPNSPT